MRVPMMITMLGLGVLLSTGCQNYLGFGTGTVTGFEISPRPDNSLNLTLGYNRYELAVIPVPEFQDAGDTLDAYSVLATINVESPGLNSYDPEDSLRITQLFATGMAARRMSNQPGMRKHFAEYMEDITKSRRGDDEQ
ncbi:MAG: hypothetical protein JJU11_03255 [Candidatus Sumerlaeia bacterium]|nr:hypothetical protein [Candidatus Sumerlaeia bacterium]